MDGGVWRATVHDHKESDTTERTCTLFKVPGSRGWDPEIYGVKARASRHSKGRCLGSSLPVWRVSCEDKHVDELAQGQEVGLGDEVLPPLGMAQSLHLTAEPLDSFALWAEGQRVRTG